MKILLTVLIVLACLANAAAQFWSPDYAAAQRLAEEKGKHLVLVFSGSDWCAPCIKLEREIWQDATFQTEADADFVFYRADFPRKRANQLSTALADRNASLAERYNPGGSFPLVMVLTPAGEVRGRTGYQKVAPAEYLAALRQMVH
ncbi:thioredoxin family protein [Lewinella sp. JB7]|uniref:thioredoxin family protein n=1 Tax=Lewinella sp. JB7 TaxID=2962887 RepID=UPI0020C95ADB|nr:thioredoxin family protein [Lewinella sp. JB7]MCP9237634.1 thioredoxin family protein [Lewinella sp. JB7]